MRTIFGFVVLAFSFLNACSNGGGSSAATSSASAAGVFVSAFTPTTGGVGSIVTIEGTHFGTDPFAVSVLFNGIPGTVQLCTEDRLLVTVPPGASTGKIAVTAPAGTFLTPQDFHVVPTLVAVNPPSPPGAAVGANVEILGFGFDGLDPQNNNQASFHSVPAAILDGSSTSLVVSVPVGAKTGEMLITAPSGTISLPYIVKPSITGYSINYGLPGAAVTLSGFNFQETPSGNQVSFNGIGAVVSAASYSSLDVVVPAGFATGAVSVTTADGTAMGPVFYLPQTPTVAGFQPISGISGETVTVQGTGFLPGATSVKFHGVAASVTQVTPTSLQAIVPAGATTGAIEVSHPFGGASSANAFTVLQTPAIASFSPPFGAWGAAVTITGSDFDPDPAGNQVRFHGVLASVLQSGPTQIIAAVPNGATSGAITVTTDAGVANSVTPFEVKFSRQALFANAVENTISSCQMDSSLGQLRYQGFVATGAGSAPNSVTVDSSGTIAFAALQGLDLVGVYSLAPNGVLALLQTIAAGDEPSSVSLHPSGSFAYATNRLGSSISVYSVGAGGTLSPVETRGTGREPLSIAFHPSGLFAYCANSQNSSVGNSVTVYTVNPSTGGLTLLQRKITDAGPRAIAMHPSGNWLFVACGDAGTVQVYQIGADGRLLIQQSIVAGTTPVALAADPLFRFLFVANRGSNDLSAYSVLPDCNLIPLGGNVPAGTAPSALVTDYSDKLYVANSGSHDVSIFSIGVSGNLQALPSVAAHRGPASIARVDGAAPLQVTPRFAYAANTFNPPSANGGPTERIIVPFAIGADGGLTVTGAGSVQTGPNPEIMAADPRGAAVYSANRGSTSAGAAISMFSVGADGGLAANGSIDIPALGPFQAAFSLDADPSGEFVFCTTFETFGGSGTVQSFRVDRSPGNLGKLLAVPGAAVNLSGFNGATTPYSSAVHPQGRFVFVLDNELFDFQIESFQADLATGALAPVAGGVLIVSDGNYIAVHPSGRFLYRDTTANKIFVHPISSSGVVGNPLPQSFDTGSQPQRMALTPDGRFLFVANKGADTVSAYQVNLMTGLLTRIDAIPGGTIQDFAVGDEPIGLAVERSGQFLYVANSGNCGTCAGPNSVSMMRIQSDGSLAPIATSFITGESPKSVATISQFQ